MVSERIVKCNSCGYAQGARNKRQALGVRSFHVKSSACDVGLEQATNVVIYKIVDGIEVPDMTQVDKLFIHKETKV